MRVLISLCILFHVVASQINDARTYKTDGLIHYMGFSLDNPFPSSGDKAATFESLLNSRGEKDLEFSLIESREDRMFPGQHLHIYQQEHKGVPLLGSTLKVLFSPTNDILSTAGKVAEIDLNLESTPSISASTASYEAHAHFQNDLNIDPSLITKSGEKLVFYRKHLFGLDSLDSVPILAHALQFEESGHDRGHSIFVHAHTGEVIASYPNSFLSTPKRGGATSTLLLDHTDDAQVATDATQAFFSNLIGLLSYDGKNGALNLAVNTNCEDREGLPYFDGVDTVYYCENKTSYDLIAHAWAAAYGEHLQGTPLLSMSLPGSLNSHFNDAIGASVNIIYGDNQSLRTGCYNVKEEDSLRWFIDHHADAQGYLDHMDLWQPSCLHFAEKTSEIECEEDKEVHNSGVSNYAFARLADGLPDQPGIGLEKTLHLHLRAKEHCQTATTTFAELAVCLTEACSLYVMTAKQLPNFEGFDDVRFNQGDCDMLDDIIEITEMSVTGLCADITPTITDIFPSVFTDRGGKVQVKFTSGDSERVWCKIGDHVTSQRIYAPAPAREVTCPVPPRSLLNDVYSDAVAFYDIFISIDGETWHQSPNQITYAGSPSVSSISPRQNTYHGNTTLIITGTGFYNFTDCFDNGVDDKYDCFNVEFRRPEFKESNGVVLKVLEFSETELLVITPPASTLNLTNEVGEVEIVITTNGRDYYNSIHPYTYIHVATLDSLVVTDCNFTFDFSERSYECEVAGDVLEVEFSFDTTADGADVTIRGPPVPMDTGVHLVDILVESVDRKNNEIYHVLLNRAKSVEHRLSELSVHTGGDDPVQCVLTPAFNPDLHVYSCSVEYTIAAVSVTATTMYKDATYMISGGNSLLVGEIETAVITVYSEAWLENEDDLLDHYVVHVTRLPNTNTQLKSLIPDGGCMIEFDPDTYEYNCDIYSGVEFVYLEAVPQYPDGTQVTIGDRADLNWNAESVHYIMGTTGSSVTMKAVIHGDPHYQYVSEYNVTVTVIANPKGENVKPTSCDFLYFMGLVVSEVWDGSNRVAPGDKQWVDLHGFEVSGDTPRALSTSVAPDVAEIKLVHYSFGAWSFPSATMAITFDTLSIGYGESKTETFYFIEGPLMCMMNLEIFREAPEDMNGALQSLTAGDSCELVKLDLTAEEPFDDAEGDFESEWYEYFCWVPYHVASVTLFALPIADEASILGYGRPLLRTNPIEILVQDLTPGSISETKLAGVFVDYHVNTTNELNHTTFVVEVPTDDNYTVYIRREFQDDTGLKDLTYGTHELRPSFREGLRDGYAVEVPFDVATFSEIDITPTPAHDQSTFTVSPVETMLVVDVPTLVTVTVTAENGIEKGNYSMNVIRKERNDARLADLRLSLDVEGQSAACNKGLIPSFSTNAYDYVCIVDKEVGSVEVYAEVEEGTEASLRYFGHDDLMMGSNILEILVTAKDGVTVQPYIVEVYRGDSNAQLSSLVIGDCVLSPPFEPSKYAYRCEEDVGNNGVEPIAVESKPKNLSDKTTVQVYNADVTRPTVDGPWQVTVVVTASNRRTKQAYQVLMNLKTV